MVHVDGRIILVGLIVFFMNLSNELNCNMKEATYERSR